MKLLRCLVVIVALYPVSAEAAGQITGNKFLDICESGTTLTDSVCWMYPAGVWHGVETMQALFKDNPKFFCSPSEATNGQVESIFRKYLRNHPEILHLSASVPVIKALKEAWPCT